MLFIFSTPVLIIHLWQLKTVVFQHRHLICAVLLKAIRTKYFAKTNEMVMILTTKVKKKQQA